MGAWRRGPGRGAQGEPPGEHREREGTALSRHRDQARDDFDRAYHRAVLGNLLARLCRRPNNLLAYQEVCRDLALAGESYRGIRAVPVAQIVGSTDRCRDFDRTFRPLRMHAAGRWVSIARAHDEGRALPPVQLYQVGDAYFVRDGHHRVSVARVRDQLCVDAEVVELLVRGPLPAQSPAEAGEGSGARRLRLRRLVGLIAPPMARRRPGLRPA